MKSAGIALFLMICLISLSFGFDVVMGYELRTSLKNVLNPFRVMETTEISILIFFILIFLADIFIPLIKKGKKLK